MAEESKPIYCKLNYWKEVHENLFTPGGDPLWECPSCGFRHCYGVEQVEGPYANCPKCLKRLKYPWENQEG